MIVLAIDTSSKKGSVAVLNRHTVLAAESWQRSNSHAEILVPAIDSALKLARVELNDINLIVVVNGPGSFTGVRVAVNCARSLAFANQTPLVCLNTDESLVLSSEFSGSTLVYLSNAHQALAFFSVWKNESGLWKRDVGLELIEVKDLHQRLPDKYTAIGDGWADPELKLPSTLKNVKPEMEFPRSEKFGAAVGTHPENFSTLVWNVALPLYIRAPGAEKMTRYVGNPGASTHS